MNAAFDFSLRVLPLTLLLSPELLDLLLCFLLLLLDTGWWQDDAFARICVTG